MINLPLGEIAEILGGGLHAPGEPRDGHIPPVQIPIAEVSTDSRTLRRGAVFFALRGEQADGHDFVDDAVDAGAAAVVVSRPVEAGVPTVTVEDTWEALAALAGEVRRRIDPTVVAVTGSVGKTTTKDLTAAAVGAGRATLAAQGSFNNELGVPLTLLSLEADTDVLVAELGARGEGHIAELMPLVRPDVGIVTRVAGVHLELFGDLDAVARAKTELVEALPSSGWAVLNADDPRVSAMADHTPAQVVRYSLRDEQHRQGPAPDLWAEDLSLDRLAIPSLTVRSPWGSARVRLPVAGLHNAGNALAALATAGILDVGLEPAASALAEAPVSAWRGEVEEAADVVILNDAYNANPTSVEAALRTLQAIERPGRRWAVLGVMAEIGPEHEAEHASIGRRAVELGVDRLVVVGEEAAAIAAGAREGGLDGQEVIRVGDAEAALEHLADSLAPGDGVLVKASRVAGLEAVAAGLKARLGEGGRP